MAQKDADKGANATAAKKNPRAILIALIVLVVVVVTGILVYRNNQQSKATHAEFAAAQKEFGASEESYKKSSQNLDNMANACEKSYAAYDLCSGLTKTHSEITDS